MKKLLRKIAIITAVECTLACTAAVSACGGVTRLKKISIDCYFDHDSITLPVSFDGAICDPPEGICFTTEHSLAEIKEEIDRAKFKNAAVTTELYGIVLLLKKQTDNNLVHYYSIERHDRAPYRSRYFVRNLVEDVNCIGNGHPYNYYTLAFPVHLLDFSRFELYNRDYRCDMFQENTPYPTRYSVSDFADFYREIQQYEVTENEDCVVVTPKAGKWLTKTRKSINDYGKDFGGFTVRIADDSFTFSIQPLD